MLEKITSDALAARHGFFTRKGGASSGIFAGLNCGPGSSDQAEVVAINRARVAEAMGVGPDHLISIHQVHSPDVIHVTAPLAVKPRADAMVTAGAKAEDIVAVIGPTISQRAYEVGQEFFESFVDEDPQAARFFANGANGRYQFDLPALGLDRLRRAGVGHASWTGHCTYSDPDRFFSYRRTTHAGECDYGRLIATIRL